MPLCSLPGFPSVFHLSCPRQDSSPPCSACSTVPSTGGSRQSGTCKCCHSTWREEITTENSQEKILEFLLENTISKHWKGGSQATNSMVSKQKSTQAYLSLKGRVRREKSRKMLPKQYLCNTGQPQMRQHWLNTFKLEYWWFLRHVLNRFTFTNQSFIILYCNRFSLSLLLSTRFACSSQPSQMYQAICIAGAQN